MIQRMLAIWSLVPLPFLKPAWTSGSSWFRFWSLAWRILSITLLVCEMSATMSSLSILWHCFSLALEWKLTFSHDHTKFQSGEYGKWSPLYAPKAKKINKSGPFKGLVMRRCHKPRITINPILGTWSTHTHTHTHTLVYKHIYFIYICAHFKYLIMLYLSVLWEQQWDKYSFQESQWLRVHNLNITFKILCPRLQH